MDYSSFLDKDGSRSKTFDAIIQHSCLSKEMTSFKKILAGRIFSFIRNFTSVDFLLLFSFWD